MIMRWKYHIPHRWDSPEERTTWEDVYLMLEEGPEDRDSLWLTVDAGMTDRKLEEAAGEWSERLAESEHADLMGRWLQVNDRELVITPDMDIWIRQENFNMHELLDWVKAFLTGFFGDPEPVLVEGTIEEFAETNQHARGISELGRALEAELGEDDGAEADDEDE
jgi:hypothetical protein